MRSIGALALCLLLAHAGPGQGEELGRLFFSPAERKALDAERRASVTRAAPGSAPLKVDGYVLPAGREGVLWLNGTATRLKADRGGQRGGAAVLIPGSNGAPVPVGATIERGAVSVRR